MKKLISIIFAVVFLLKFSYAYDYSVIGKVLSTDIIAFIDEQPIHSYNIEGYTYVCAEDLSGYGFDVVWDSVKRELNILRNKEADRVFPEANFINVKKEAVKIGENVSNVYNTDIVTYLNDKKIPACNVNGKTLINTELLSDCGVVSYNNSTRTIKIDLLSFDINEYLTKKTNIIQNEKIEGKTFFNGILKNGLFDGYGVITEEYNYTNGLQSEEKYFISGFFKDGKKNGYICNSGYKIPLNGSDRRKRDYFSLAKYKNDEIAGYCLSITYSDGILDVRNEQNGNYKRICVPDSDYKYGYKILNEGETDSWGEIISYKKIPAPKIENVEYDYYSGTSIVYDMMGKMYAFGNNIFKESENNMYSSDVPVLTNKELLRITDNFSLSDGKLYKNLSSGDKYLISDSVKSYSANSNYLMFMKDDNSVYTARLNFEEGSGSAWNDELDLSKPVKVFENAKYISNKGRYCVIDNNNTLWYWSSPYYKTEYENIGNYKVKTPVKVAENVIMAECASGFIAYVKSDNSLYISKDFESDNNVFGVEAEKKILDDVKAFCVSQRKILAVKSNGTLWTMGFCDNYTLGIPFLKEAPEMTKITVFGN